MWKSPHKDAEPAERLDKECKLVSVTASEPVAESSLSLSEHQWGRGHPKQTPLKTKIRKAKPKESASINK